jgi:hypothetical protein
VLKNVNGLFIQAHSSATPNMTMLVVATTVDEYNDPSDI